MRRLVLVLLLLTALPLQAATYHVAKSGTDAVSCPTATSVSTPKLTIAAGMACMAPGDTLYIRSGSYTEPLTWSLACTAAQPCTMAGYPGDARPVIVPGDHDALGVIKFGVRSDSYLTIRDLDIDGSNQPVNRGGIAIYMAHTTVENVTITNISRSAIGGVGTAQSPDYDMSYAVIRNNTITNCGRLQPFDEFDTKGIGIYMQGANSLVEGNLVDGCRAGGVEINYEDNINIVVRNNILRNGGTSSPWGAISSNWSGGCCRDTNPRGVTVGGAVVATGPTDNFIYNNIIHNMTGTNGQGRCFAFWGGADNLLANNTCYNSNMPYNSLCVDSHVIMQNNIWAGTTAAPSLCGAITGTISHNLTNPTLASTFVNAAGGDFHLVLGASAIDAGTAQAAIAVDYDGVSRPQNGVFDLGAYEFTGSAAPPPELVLHLPLDEGTLTTADDASAYDQDGTLTNGATWAAGIVGPWAVALDGVDDSILVNDASPLDLTTAFSLAVWVRPSATLTTWATALVKNLVYYLYAGSQDACTGVFAGFQSAGGSHVVCDNTPLTALLWTHLAVTYDGTTLLLYKNATPVGTPLSITAAIDTSSTPLQIGNNQLGSAFPGRIDDARVYNYGLSAAEVAGLYALQNPPSATGARIGASRLGNARLIP
jgi:Concanavalin A-like lectin/glucanases superfamily/Right handed beta helix region